MTTSGTGRGPHRRRFPRIASQQDGMVQVPRKRSSDPSGRPVMLPCTITSLSPEGVGFVVQRPVQAEIDQRALLTLAFHLDDEIIELAVTVAWSEAASTEGVSVGARLRLEVADADTRQRYARWIAAALGHPRGDSVPRQTQP